MTSLLTVFVPAGMEGTMFEDVATVNGHAVTSRHHARPWNGYWVVDIPLGFFVRMLDGPQGKYWHDANHEALEWMGHADRRVMTCNAFPGEHRAQRVAPASADSAPVFVRLSPPEGVTHYSHNGREIEIAKVAKNGVITVEEPVAAALRGHGFRDAA